MPLEDDIQQLNKKVSETLINYRLINNFFAHACTQYPPYRVWWLVIKSNKEITKQQQQQPQTNQLNQKKTKKQAKKIQHKTRIRDREITRGKIIHFLQIFTDIAFNPWPGSCCNAQRYGNNDGG